MANLYAPKDRSDLTAITPHEPFRFTFQTEQEDKRLETCIGMVIGTGSQGCVLVIRKNGSLMSWTNIHGCKPRRFEFLDYLLESDSITIFGGAQNEDQVPEPDQIPIPNSWAARPFPREFKDIPLNTPFASRYDRTGSRHTGADWTSMIIEGRHGEYNLISFAPDMRHGSDRQGYGGECQDVSYGRSINKMAENYTFVGWVDPDIWVPRFKKHACYVQY